MKKVENDLMDLVQLEVLQDIENELERRKKTKKPSDCFFENTKSFDASCPSLIHTDDTEYLNLDEVKKEELLKQENNTLLYKNQKIFDDDIYINTDSTLVKSPNDFSKIKLAHIIFTSILVLFSLIIFSRALNSFVENNRNLSKINTQIPYEPSIDNTELLDNLKLENAKLSTQIEELKTYISQLASDKSNEVPNELENAQADPQELLEQDTQVDPQQILEQDTQADPQEILEQDTIEPTTNDDSIMQQPTKYIVKEGDTLMGIALKQYGKAGDYLKIANANNIVNLQIKIGQELIIP